jgi:CRISPR-associated protein Cmr2
MNNDHIWQTKLASRIHDPAEKALVLLRDPAGHEGGSIVEVGKALGFETRYVSRRDGSTVEKLKLVEDMERIVEQADHWAAAADRAQFPRDPNERFESWAQVRFAEEGELVHPLSGERYEVRNIGQQILAEHVKAVSRDHLQKLIHPEADGSPGSPDYRLTTLAFWRFGPELGQELQGIGPLWNLLPADTRTPDHTIWQHLDLTSALAGAMAGGGHPALLTVSIGPVQDFIAAARSTSDLWAGSHFLSTLAWQAMQVVAEEYGPDAILFPQLRAVPLVDLWLIDQGVSSDLFKTAAWNDTNTDYNPLFVAALPNKFVAMVPEPMAPRLPNQIRQHVRQWVLKEARTMLDRLLLEINEQPQGQHCYRQLEEQLRDFPEVHWSVVPWQGAAQAETALKAFCPAGEQPSFFQGQAWKLLHAAIEPQQGWRFWEPNDGVLYPAIHELGERTLAVAKSARPFSQLEQRGYRDSLTGEHEWLTLDENQLDQGSPRQRTDTLWARVSRAEPSWAKKGEHLSAFGLIKRLWPERFIEIVKNSRWYRGLADKPDLSRYVVSTHVMALAPSLERLMKDGPSYRHIDREKEREKYEEARKAYQWLEEQTKALKRPALPRRLMRRELREGEWWDVATRLPSLIEQERERVEDEQEEGSIAKVVARIETAIGRQTERYYGLLLMDGDRLGAWLSGTPALRYEQAFHSRVAAGLRGYHPRSLRDYLAAPRPASPARHMAISSALNGFALDLVRHVVEQECLGKVLYAGGDDVMAMVCVRDLVRAMALLRVAYSGGLPDEGRMPTGSNELECQRGFVRLRNRLYQVMGTSATASCGAVIAHHQAPLAMVLRELRAAEKRAKTDGGRDAFSITVIKRSGGTQSVTAKWGEPLDVLLALRNFLADQAVSRRAVYNSLVWLKDLPPNASDEMLASLLAYQFRRQTSSDAAWKKHDGSRLCSRIAALAYQEKEKDRLDRLSRFMGVAEFLAREARAGLE